MAAKKTELPDNARKRKRIVPTRAAGTPAFDVVDDLFATAFANRPAPNSSAPIEPEERVGTVSPPSTVSRVGTVKKNFPVWPDRNFQKVAYSVVRDVSQGTFSGKSN